MINNGEVVSVASKGSSSSTQTVWIPAAFTTANKQREYAVAKVFLEGVVVSPQ
jgi:hypothetical protein